MTGNWHFKRAISFSPPAKMCIYLSLHGEVEIGSRRLLVGKSVIFTRKLMGGVVAYSSCSGFTEKVANST